MPINEKNNIKKGKALELADIASYLKSPKGFRFELISRRHTSSILKWRNDTSINKYFIRSEKLTLEKQNNFLKNYETKDRLDFVLLKIDQEIPVGVFSLINISSRPELGKLIGEKSFRGKGIARSATIYLLKFAFNYLMLNEVWATTQIKNTRNIELNESIGFKTIGEKRINKKRYYVMKIDRRGVRWCGN